MPQNKLIIISCALFVLAAGYLFWQNEKELDPQNNKSFWNLSFAFPERRESLDFTIENFTDKTDFEYTITVNKQVLEKNTISIEKTRKATVKPLHTATEGTPTVITITHGTDKKEISRK